MVAAVWLEYPESLWRSLWTTFSARGDALLSAPMLDWYERLAATLASTLAWAAAAGDRRPRRPSMTPSPSLSSEW
jgi:hypothetical protein